MKISESEEEREFVSKPGVVIWIAPGFLEFRLFDGLHIILYTQVDRKEPLKAVFFETENGNQPVRDFILELSREDRKDIGSDIFTVQKRFPLGLPLVEKLDIDLWEVRSHIPDGICRIFFTIFRETMVLLHGFVKKSQKIPSKEMKTAKGRLAEFRRLRK